MKYFPKLYHHYDATLQQVCTLSPSCDLPVPKLPFASYTLNVGCQSVCNVHVDGCNLSSGLCLVIPSGSFNHEKGGHLIFHELRLFFELPAGSIVLFPSAIISHENIGISKDEQRQALTAFTPGRLFQWVDASFGLVSEMSFVEGKLEYGARAWQEGKLRFPHITSLF